MCCCIRSAYTKKARAKRLQRAREEVSLQELPELSASAVPTKTVDDSEYTKTPVESAHPATPVYDTVVVDVEKNVQKDDDATRVEADGDDSDEEGDTDDDGDDTLDGDVGDEEMAMATMETGGTSTTIAIDRHDELRALATEFATGKITIDEYQTKTAALLGAKA